MGGEHDFMEMGRKFAQAVKSQPILYDKRYPGHKNKVKTAETLRSIIEHLEGYFSKEALHYHEYDSIEGLEMKLRSARRCFSVWNRKLKLGKVKQGMKLWYLYKDYQFLDGHINQLKKGLENANKDFHLPEDDPLEKESGEFRKRDEGTFLKREQERQVKNYEMKKGTGFQVSNNNEIIVENNGKTTERETKSLKKKCTKRKLAKKKKSNEMKNEESRTIGNETEFSKVESKGLKVGTKEKPLKSEEINKKESASCGIEEPFINLLNSYFAIVENPSQRLQIQGEILQVFQKHIE